MKVKGFNICYDGSTHSFDTSEFDQFVYRKEIVSVDQICVEGVTPPIIWILVSYFESHDQRSRKADRSNVLSTLSADRHGVFAVLRTWRSTRASRLTIQPYLVMKDEVMVDICRRLPKTLTELQQIRGIGEGKIREFGEELLGILRDAIPEGLSTRAGSQAAEPVDGSADAGSTQQNCDLPKASALTPGEDDEKK